MSFLSVIEDIGKDIVKGVSVAAKIPGVSTIPLAGPVISELGQIITAFESSGQTVTQEQLSQIVQALAAANAVRQSSGVASSTTHTTTTVTTPTSSAQ